MESQRRKKSKTERGCISYTKAVETSSQNAFYLKSFVKGSNPLGCMQSDKK